MNDDFEIPHQSSCTIDLTEECNMACDYCFTHSQHNKKVLSEEMGKKIIDLWFLNVMLDSSSNKTPNISFWGGEPLLEFELMKKLIKYGDEISNNTLTYGGTTNGTLYTAEVAEWCLKNKSPMLVSSDGVEEAHDKHRKFKNGRGTWKVIDKNLREIVKFFPKQKVRLSISTDNCHLFYDSFLYFIEGLGMKEFSFSPVFEDDWTKEKFDILEEQFNKCIDYILKEAKRNNFIDLKHFTDIMLRNGSEQIIRNPCGAGTGYSAWSIEGLQFACQRFNKHGLSLEEKLKSPFLIGRIKDDKYEIYREPRQQFINFKDKLEDRCGHCSLLKNSNCYGNCFSVNYDLMGDINKTPKVCCDFNKLQNDMGLKLRKLFDDNKIIHPKMKQKQIKNGCGLCYNMCYSEGTDEEITIIDRRKNHYCNCDVIEYSDNLKRLNCRSIKEIDDDSKKLFKSLETCKKILETRDMNKREDLIKMEDKVFNDTIESIKKFTKK